jgi:hypothetical protein
VFTAQKEHKKWTLHEKGSTNEDEGNILKQMYHTLMGEQQKWK